MKTVVVVGGGITGLCTMHYLKRQMLENNVEANLILMERNAYLGGKMYSIHDENYIMETGADSIVARHQGVLELVEDLNLASSLVYNETGISYIHTNNKLHAIPAGSIFGIPMSEEALQASTLISEEGKKRVLQDLQLPNTKFTKDSSLGEFLTYFLGEEIVQKQITPILAGVYSGNIYELSLASTLPYLLDYKNDYGSILKGLEANKKQFENAANKKFISFQGGLSTLIDRLEESLPDVQFMKNTGIQSISKLADKYEVLAGDQTIEADVVVLAVPNTTARQVLKDEKIQQELAKFSTASALTVYLGFDVPNDYLPVDGTGFIVSTNSDLTCDASTWTSRKWKHTSKNERLLVRMFYKNSNARYEELASMTDEQLIEVAKQDVKKSLGLEESPIAAYVTKWMDQMPRYGLQHNATVTNIEKQLAEHYPNVYIAGCSYYGVGIGACIQNGKQTANKIMANLF